MRGACAEVRIGLPDGVTTERTRAERHLRSIWTALLILLAPIMGAAQLATPGVPDEPGAGPSPRPVPPQTLVVKYRATGPHALRVCADRLSSRGASFQPHLADGSDSLDRIRQRFDLGRQRALFRGPTDQPLAVARAALRARFANRGAAVRAGDRPLPDLAHIYRLEVPSGVSPDALLDALRADPHVAYVQHDHAHVLDQAAPPFDDPFLTSAGSWGQPYADLWGPAYIRAPEVWPFAQGEGAVVAIVDTGVDQTHPDIAANLWVNPGEDLDGNGLAEPSDANGIDDDGNGFIDDLTGFDFANSIDANEDGDFDDPGDVSDADPQDDNGHGTHVAGTLAAVANNGIGIVGIAPSAKVMALKGFSAEGSASDVVLWRAVLYAAENGATVINNSWSCSSPCPVNPLAEDVLELVEALGSIVVTSAGNKSDDVAFYSPENGDRVITVGAVGVDGLLPGFTNRGWLVDLVAPGGGPEEPLEVRVARRNILSLRAAGTGEDEPAFIIDDEYLRLAGTSMSSPHAAGAVAILRALRPELTPAQVRLLARLSARDAGSPGYDPEYGAGDLDLVRLLDSPLPALRLELDAPRVGRLHDPASGPIVVRGTAEGEDLESIEVAIARGLSGRDFIPLEAFGDSHLDWAPGVGAAVLATWDIAAVPDGPHVIRVRARLRDGRLVDEFTIVGIESNHPVRLSGGLLDTAAPDLSGVDLVWQVAEPVEPPVPSDLVLGQFPKPIRWVPIPARPAERQLVFAGNQRSPARDGSELAWLETTTGGRLLQRCHLDAGKFCVPRPLSGEGGLFSAPYVAGGWIVWTRTAAEQRFIEGCPVGSANPDCVPRALIDPASGTDWILHSFDGDSLLVSRPGRFARCRLVAPSVPCSPADISFPPGVAVIDPVHDGELMAFSRVDVGFAPPPGCGIFDPRPGCSRQIVVLITYLACTVDPTTAFCDPIAVSDQQPIERSLGIEVSGRRVVWAMGGPAELPAIRFCEFDSVAGKCPAQRVGGGLAAQSEPTIDGNRIAWSDGRAGEIAVWGLPLPNLRGPALRVLKASGTFSITLEAESGSSPTLRYEIEGVEGVAPEAAFAAIVDGGEPGGRISLVGRIPVTASGTTRWRVRAVGSGGLSSEHVIELAIVPRPAQRR